MNDYERGRLKEEANRAHDAAQAMRAIVGDERGPEARLVNAAASSIDVASLAVYAIGVGVEQDRPGKRASDRAAP